MSGSWDAVPPDLEEVCLLTKGVCRICTLAIVGIVLILPAVSVGHGGFLGIPFFLRKPCDDVPRGPIFSQERVLSTFRKTQE